MVCIQLLLIPPSIGAWFAYGQTPSLFIASWRKVVGKVREIAGTENIAFVWAPNSGNGYPFPGQKYSVLPKGPKWEAALDTNGNGEFDTMDDPYSPYYPGDEWVDWVGMKVIIRRDGSQMMYLMITKLKVFLRVKIIGDSIIFTKCRLQNDID
jgi:beta-mannanase